MLIHAEIKVLRSVNHPHVIRFVEMFESPVHLSIITELASGMQIIFMLIYHNIMIGGELFEQLCEKGSFRELDAIRLLSQIFEALKYLHEKG